MARKGGPKPTPTLLKLVSGSAGVMLEDEPMPEGELNAPPAAMTKNQKAIWRYTIEHSPKGLLRLLDMKMLTIWVVACDLHEQACKIVQKKGMIVRSSTQGLDVQSAALPIINRQAEIMLRAASELGFSPTSRTRISLGGSTSKKAPNKFSGNAAKKSA